MESLAVRRCRITLRLRDAELREATVQLMRRENAGAGAFAVEDLELAQIAVEQARAACDLAALDLEESLAVEGGKR